MFSLVDTAILILRRNKQWEYREDARTREIRFTQERTIWVVFTGWKCSIEQAIRIGLIPRVGTAQIWEFPIGLIHPDPHEAKRIFCKITRDIDAYVEARLRDGYTVNVLSYSAGNSFGFYTANTFAVKKFISIVTGARIGEEIWAGLATQRIRQASERLGIASGTHYNAPLTGFLPMDHTENLPRDTTFYLGLFDRVMPLSAGREVVRKVRARNPHARVYFFPTGHIFTGVVFGALNRLRWI